MRVKLYQRYNWTYPVWMLAAGSDWFFRGLGDLDFEINFITVRKWRDDNET
jgi:hypothetical protein